MSAEKQLSSRSTVSYRTGLLAGDRHRNNSNFSVPLSYSPCHIIHAEKVPQKAKVMVSKQTGGCLQSHRHRRGDQISACSAKGLVASICHPATDSLTKGPNLVQSQCSQPLPKEANNLAPWRMKMIFILMSCRSKSVRTPSASSPSAIRNGAKTACTTRSPTSGTFPDQ